MRRLFVQQSPGAQTTVDVRPSIFSSPVYDSAPEGPSPPEGWPSRGAEVVEGVGPEAEIDSIDTKTAPDYEHMTMRPINMYMSSRWDSAMMNG